MAGRHAKPIELHLQNGNKRHLTKAEIEYRKESEIKIGDKKLLCPAYIKKDIAAFSKWKEIKHIYKDADFISSGDTGILSRYCMTYSQYLNLLKRLNRIGNIQNNSEDIEEYIENSDEFDYKIKRQLLDMISTDGVLRIEKAVNQKLDILIKMEDRLFLNPAAKIKNIPKKEKNSDDDPNMKKMFGDI